MKPCTAHVTAQAAALLCMAAAATAQTARIEIGRNINISRAHPNDAHYEVIAAADPRDPSRLVAASFRFPENNTASSTIIYASRDGGLTWSPALQGDALLYTSDPALTYGPDGYAYYTASLLGPPPSPRDQRKMLAVRSADGGATWATPDTMTYSDRQYMTVDRTGGKYHGRIYVNGNNRVPYGIADFIVFRSTDHGRTWEGPGKREAFGKLSASSMGNAVVTSDGTLIGIFADGNLLQAIASTNGGESLEPAVTIDGKLVSGGNRKGGHNNAMSLPQIAIDESNGPRRDQLYAVWGDRRSGQSRIWFATSTDRGATWSAAKRVDDAPANDSTDYFMPAIAVNADGVVGVLWYDRRNHPDNQGWDARFTASLDGGRTFLPSVNVSEQGSSFGKNTQWSLRHNVTHAKPEDGGGLNVDVSLNTFTFVGGDTNGLVATADGTFHPVWVDNHTGVAQLWTAAVKVTKAPPVEGTDISENVTLDFGEYSYDRGAEALTAVVRLRNTSAKALHGPFRVHVTDIESELGDISIAGSENGTAGAGAEWVFDDALLAPGATSQPKTLHLTLTNMQPFRSGNRYLLGLLRMKLNVTVPGAR